MALLTQWTFDGYFRWLRGLRTQYRHRRDFLVDCLAEEFELLSEMGTAVALRVHARLAGREDEECAAAAVVRATLGRDVRLGEVVLWGRAGQEGRK